MGSTWAIERLTVMSDNPPNIGSRLYVFRSVTFDIGAIVDHTYQPDLDLSLHDPPLVIEAGAGFSAWIIGNDGAQFSFAAYGWQR